MQDTVSGGGFRQMDHMVDFLNHSSFFTHKLVEILI